MDLFNWFFRQQVTEAEMDEAFSNAQLADQDLVVALGIFGVTLNGDADENAGVPDLTIDITAPIIAYDQDGQRIYIPGTGGNLDVDVSVDSNAVSTAVATPGNEKIVSVFIQFDRALSEPRIDGNSNTVQFRVSESYAIIVEQGAESAAPATPPPLRSDAILLCDVTRTNPQTQIFTADVDLSRKQDLFNISTTDFTIQAGTIVEAITDFLTELQNHVDNAASAHPADAITFDDTSLPIPVGWSAVAAATEVQGAIDGIVDDLTQNSGVDGASLIGYDPSGVADLSATTVATALDELADEKADLDGGNTWSGTQTFDQDPGLIYVQPSANAGRYAIREIIEADSLPGLTVTTVHNYTMPADSSISLVVHGVIKLDGGPEELIAFVVLSAVRSGSGAPSVHATRLVDAADDNTTGSANGVTLTSDGVDGVNINVDMGDATGHFIARVDGLVIVNS